MRRNAKRREIKNAKPAKAQTNCHVHQQGAVTWMQKHFEMSQLIQCRMHLNKMVTD